jgi:DNA modification methylase
MTELRIETVNINSLTPDPANARKHDGKNLKAIASSLEKFGQRKPIVVTPDSIVVAGNGTVEAAKSLGWTQIAISRTPVGWTWDQIKAFALADNRTAELAEWDDKVLADQLLELDANGWELEELGFENLEPTTSDDDDEPLSFDDAPLRAKLGDHWIIGDHHVICGDSTDRKTLDRAFAKFKIGCLLTDPPYGMNLDTKYSTMHKGNGFGKGGNDYTPVIGDDKPYDAKPLIDYFIDVKEQFLFGADYYGKTILDGGSWLVWDKRANDSGMDLDKLLGAAFELCWSRQKHKRKILRHLWSGHHGMQKEDTKSRVHPTQKPISLLVEILETWSDQGCIVADPFAGSGATLLAAAKTNRKAIGIELDPKYVDVILDRLEKQTGLEAQLLED